VVRMENVGPKKRVHSFTGMCVKLFSDLASWVDLLGYVCCCNTSAVISISDFAILQ
jgi:hypothetical protein